MFTAGWMGLTAGWLRRICDFRFQNDDSPKSSFVIRHSSIRFAALIVFAVTWGFLYGAIMNLWSWPFLAGDPAQSWQAGLSVADGLKRYAVFYVATSLWWDAFAALGNVALILLFGRPTLKALLRFRDRFLFEVSPHSLYGSQTPLFPGGEG
jgi:energy-coupling factor transport system substrate-specific component